MTRERRRFVGGWRAFARGWGSILDIGAVHYSSDRPKRQGRQRAGSDEVSWHGPDVWSGPDSGRR